MKKRILSLVLAFAMAATLAPAMAGTNAEAAGADGTAILYAPTTSGGGMSTAMPLSVKTKNGGERADGQVKVGDVISIADLGKNEADPKFNMRIIDEAGDIYNVDSENVNFQWVAAKPNEKFEAIEGATGSTYTVTDDEVEKVIAVVIWVPSRERQDANDQTYSEEVLEFDDVVNQITASKFDNRTFNAPALNGVTANSVTPAFVRGKSTLLVGLDGNDSTVPTDGYKGAYYAYSTTSARVSKGDPVDAMFKLTSAEAYNGTGVIQIGNTLVVAESQIMEYKYSTTTKDKYQRLKLTFDLEDGYSYKDVWGTKKVDVANGKTSDPLVWALAEQTNNNLSTKPSDATMSADGSVNGKGHDAADVTDEIETGTPYDIYIVAKGAGDKYNKKVIQTRYSLVIIDDNGGSNLIALDLNGGDLPSATADRYRFRQYNVTNDVTKTTDKIAARTVDSTVNLSEQEQRMYDLPTLPKKGDKFFQGWSEEARTGAVMNQTSNLVTRYNKTYYAVFGDKEVANNVPVGGQKVYRMRDPKTNEHLYTATLAEVNGLAAQGWEEEVCDFYGQAAGGKRVQRLFNPVSGEHIYVDADGNEKRVLTSQQGWLAEEIIFRSADEGVPMYRLYNPMATNPKEAHLYTTDANEYNTLGAQGWNREGVYFFGVK